ncbi:unnamed protein product, partial [Onchocerca ochengi]|uniref:Peptidase_M24 domain-containing protein n=1 Tax=Onchocerca ochengi TaxID=42157 RepID=A0A182EXQ8_ONCOC
ILPSSYAGSPRHMHEYAQDAMHMFANEIGDVICAEIPDADVDKDLCEIVTKNMIHGPCDILNPKSPCMIDGKCSNNILEH